MNRLDCNFLPTENFYNSNKNNYFEVLKKTAKILIFSSLFSSIIIFIVVINVYLIGGNKDQSFKDIFLSFFKDYSLLNESYNTNLDPIRRAIWINIAALMAGVALSIASAVAQSLTQNILSDATTLGMVDASIFGIILMKTFFSLNFSYKHYHWFYLLFSFLFSGIVLLCLIFFLSNKSSKFVKLILFGLILNIFFKTMIHLLKNYNANSVNAIFALAIGGSENVFPLFSSQFQLIKIFFIFLLIIFLITLIISKKLNLCELGLDQAQSLGVNVKYLKIIGYVIILIATNIAIVLAGSIAFIGLLSTHISRFLFRTRKYQIIIPVSSILSALIMSIAVFLNISFPQIASSVFVLFFGSLTLLFLIRQNRDI